MLWTAGLSASSTREWVPVVTIPVSVTDHTQSGFNPCHANMPQLIDAVQRGVMLSGALPVPFPTVSLHESFAHPTSMFLRNLMSMDTEEMIRAQPMDAVILIGGCDKTVPAQLMGAISADVPAVQLVVGPMVTGSHRGTRVGACTDCRGYWGRYRAGEIDIEEIGQVGNELVPSAGTCGVMGTGKRHHFDLCCTLPLTSAHQPQPWRVSRKPWASHRWAALAPRPTRHNDSELAS
jgi:dihydroxyacid dehydratase/phosphogluconate dehydratase